MPMLLVRGPDFEQHLLSNFPEERDIKGTFKGTWGGLTLEQFLSVMLEYHQCWGKGTDSVWWYLAISSDLALWLLEQKLFSMLLKDSVSRADVGYLCLETFSVFQLSLHILMGGSCFTAVCSKKGFAFGSREYCGHMGKQQHAWVHLAWGLPTTGRRVC